MAPHEVSPAASGPSRDALPGGWHRALLEGFLFEPVLRATLQSVRLQQVQTLPTISLKFMLRVCVCVCLCVCVVINTGTIIMGFPDFK